MFPADMETHTPLPTSAERYASIRERICARLEAEGARYSVARMVDLLLLELLTWMIAWCVNRDEQRLLEQACQNDIVSADAGVAECAPAAGLAATGGDAAVVRVIAAVAELVATGADCVRGKGRARAACGRRMRGRPAHGRPAFGRPALGRPALGRPAFGRRHLATTVQGLSALNDERRVFEALFAKTELRVKWNCVDFVAIWQ